MRTILGFIALVMVFGVVNTQVIFDYDKFLITFGLGAKHQFDYDRFVEVFFPISASHRHASNSFDYQNFVNTFLTPRGIKPEDFDYARFVETFIKTKSGSTQGDKKDVINFDFEEFKKAFGLECQGDCPKEFDYERFLKVFNLVKDSSLTFDYERFLDTFNLKMGPTRINPFDLERFRETFLVRRHFDYGKFEQTFLSIPNLRGGGSVLIVGNH